MKKTESKKEAKKEAKKEKPLAFELLVPIYDMAVDVFLGDVQDFAKWVNNKFALDEKLELKGEQLTSDGLTFDMEAGFGIAGYIAIYFKNIMKYWDENLPLAVSIIAHEALHAAKSIMVSRGLPFNEENDESVAYIQEYIVKNIVRTVQDAKKEKK